MKDITNLEDLKQEVVSSKSSHGTGGMQSKIDAATIAQKAGIETWIVNGLKDNFITNSFENNSALNTAFVNRLRSCKLEYIFPELNG